MFGYPNKHPKPTYGFSTLAPYIIKLIQSDNGTSALNLTYINTVPPNSSNSTLNELTER